jgi:hypothetical protein
MGYKLCIGRKEKYIIKLKIKSLVYSSQVSYTDQLDFCDSLVDDSMTGYDYD